jgi:hypothetical protein
MYVQLQNTKTKTLGRVRFVLRKSLPESVSLSILLGSKSGVEALEGLFLYDSPRFDDCMILFSDHFSADLDMASSIFFDFGGAFRSLRHYGVLETLTATDRQLYDPESVNLA